MKFKTIFKSISYVTIGLILGKIAAFIKHAIIVKYSGINYNADVFFIANTIPETITNVILAGMLTGAFIPIASEVLAKYGNAEFKRFVHNAFSIFGLLLLIVGLLILVSASKLGEILAPGYGIIQKELIANIIVIFSPGIFFIGLAAILTGILQSLEKFLIPSFGFLIANGTTIIMTILFFDKIGIYAPALGTSMGFFLWFLFQVPSASKYIFRRMQFSVQNVHIIKLAKLSLPTILIILVNNFILIIEKIVASIFIEGTVTQLNLAFRITLFFSNILIIPLGTVLLPIMSKEFGKNNIAKLYQVANKAFILVTVILFMVIIVVLFNARLISMIVYIPFNFPDAAIQQIAQYLQIYTLAFCGLFFYLILLRIFFSTQRVKNLLKANLFGLILYIMVVFGLNKLLNSYVLPLGYGLFYLATSFYLFWILRRELFVEFAPMLNKFIMANGILFSALAIIVFYLTRDSDVYIYQGLLVSIVLISAFLLTVRKRVVLNFNFLFTSFNKIQNDSINIDRN